MVMTTQPEDYNEDDVAFEGKSNAPTAEEGYPSGTPIEALSGAEPIDLESDSASEAIVEEGFEPLANALGSTDQETVDSAGGVAFNNTADNEDVAAHAQVELTTRGLTEAATATLTASGEKRPSLAPSTGQQENLG